MKDHNWNRGGYGVLDVSGVLEYSSNIGVSRLIDQAYHDDPDAFVRGLNREGVGRPLHLPFVGAGEPWVRHPEKQGRYWKNWSKTALAWMSIGYETMLPPISTLTFYNAIANNGRMVKPRFVTAELEEGRVVREFPVEEIMPSICKPSTLADIQEILEKVVSKGLGKKAGNGGKYFRVSGKTGTAMIASGSGGGYRSGTPRYMVSFCGYFPSEAPKYSCIVCIVKRGLPASGGGQCGPVFSEISQYIMSKGMYRDAEEAADSTSVFVPDVAQSNAQQTRELAKKLGLDIRDINECAADTVAMGIVPDVKGMGARDAVYEMQRRGLKVKLHGSGRVKEQNMPPGTHVVKGKTITLTLKE
jgi:cell division protein FtsI (penicillin-binding protein 3)